MELNSKNKKHKKLNYSNSINEIQELSYTNNKACLNILEKGRCTYYTKPKLILDKLPNVFSLVYYSNRYNKKKFNINYSDKIVYKKTIHSNKLIINTNEEKLLLEKNKNLIDENINILPTINVNL